MFFLDPLFDKNLFDAFYAYQFCQLIRQTSESMNKEVISVNQEMEKINRLVFIKLMLRHFDTETSWRYKPSRLLMCLMILLSITLILRRLVQWTIMSSSSSLYR